MEELLCFASRCIEGDFTFSVVLIDGLTVDDGNTLQGEDGSDSDEDNDPVVGDADAAGDDSTDGSDAEGAEEENSEGSGEEDAEGSQEEDIEGAEEKDEPCLDRESDSDRVRESKRRARRLFSVWRLDQEVARRRRVPKCVHKCTAVARATICCRMVRYRIRRCSRGWRACWGRGV